MGRRAAAGVVALGGRQLLVHGANALGAVFLARWLEPAEFGVVGVVAWLATSLTALAGGGLGPSLVRQEHEPDTADLRTVFTAQQALALAVAVAAWIAAPAVVDVVHRPSGDAWLVRLLGALPLVATVQMVPTARLERRLDFRALALVEGAQAIAFNGVAVGLVWHGMGAACVGPACAVRTLVGAGLAALACPWPLGWRVDGARIRRHVAFALAFQGTTVATLVKDGAVPVVVGALSGAAAVGQVNWAQLVATAPTWALIVLQRLWLSAFARLQHDRVALARLVEHAVTAANGFVAPVAILTLVLVDPLTRLVFGERWLAAVPILVLLWIANLVVPTVLPLLGLLHAVGRAPAAFRMALVWMVSTWTLAVPLVSAFGGLGFGVANVLVHPTNLMLFRLARAEVPCRLLRAAAPPWLWAATVGAAVYVGARMLPPAGLATLALWAAAGLALYAGGFVLRDPSAIRRALRGPAAA